LTFIKIYDIIYIEEREGGKNMLDLKSAMLDYRAKHNISQTELARRCKLSMQTVCNIENGTQSPSKLTERKILNVIKNEKEN
jgi:transcriptional regulator with XRE-family HTH domain